ASGGARLGGETDPMYQCVADGSVAIGGSSFSPSTQLSVDGSGSVSLGSTSTFRSSAHHFTSDGNAVFALGGASIMASDFGTPTHTLGFTMRVLTLVASFTEDFHEGDAV